LIDPANACFKPGTSPGFIFDRKFSSLKGVLKMNRSLWMGMHKHKA